MSVKVKNFISFSIIFILIFLLALYQFKNAKTQDVHLQEIKDKTLQTALLSDELKFSVVQVQQFLSDISATRAQDGLDDGLKSAEEFSSLFKKDTERLKQLNPEDVQELDSILSSFEDYYFMGKKMAQAYIIGGPKKGNQIMGNFDKVSEAIQDKVNTYQKSKIASINNSVDDVRNLINSNENAFIIFGIISLLIGVIVAVLLSRSILIPLRKLIEGTTVIANGDLRHNVDLKSNDEFGKLAEAFNGMRQKLSNLIQQINFTTEQIASSSVPLAAGAEQTGKATEQITIAVQEVAAGAVKQVSYTADSNQAVSEISNAMNDAAKSIQSIADFSLTTKQKATLGAEVVSDAIEQMHVVQRNVDSTSRVINTLGDKSQSIGQIVQIIGEIANQTNLLALNAAIEAARAGDHGRGFAVVADEVRKLAEQSASAAGEIRELISHIQLEATKAVDSMGQGTASVNEGITMVHQTGNTFKEMLSMIEEISSQSQEVSAIVEQVNASSQNMVDTVNEVARISEQSSENTQNVAAAAEEQNASMEEIKASSESLSKMALVLQDAVGQFKL